MDKLRFTTTGQPICTEGAGYERAFQILEELKLDGMELEFVHGVRMSPPNQKLVKELSKAKDMVLTAHGPYYINLNSKEDEKIEASKKRIIDTAKMAESIGGYSITYHAAFYMGMDKKDVYNRIEKSTAEIVETLQKENVRIWIRPETTGKGTQWGDVEEIVRLSKTFEQVLPCVDFSHLHARTNGKYNTYDEFAKVFETIGNEIGQYALENFHAHIAGIEYGEKGEKKHLLLEESDMNYKDLMKAFKDFDVKGVVVCESPIMEKDAVLLKTYYESL